MTRSSSLAIRQYSIEPRTKKYVKGYGFLSFARKYKKAIGYRIYAAYNKVVHKTGEFLENRIVKNKVK